MDIIIHASNVFKAYDIEPGPLDRLFHEYMRRHREIGASSRRLLADVVFGVMRWKRRLDGWLYLIDVKRPGWKDRILCYLAWKNPSEMASMNAEAMNLEAGFFSEEMPRNFPGDEAAFYSFPDFLYSKLVDAFGRQGARDIAKRLNEPSSAALRVNTSRTDRARVLHMLREEGIECVPTNVSPFGIRLCHRINIEGIAAYKDGLVEIQDEASQIATMLANPGPEGRVLDACAGAGGKTLMLAMLMENRGSIVASDIDTAKLKVLRSRAKRAKASCIEVIPADELRRREKLRGGFDVVLIDAPCSGTGTLRRNPDARWRLDQEIIEARVKTQMDLLAEYGRWIRPGGRLVYITCSILPEENDRIVQAFLRQGDFCVANAAGILQSNGIPSGDLVGCDGMLRTDPRKGDWDGFFAATLDDV